MESKLALEVNLPRLHLVEELEKLEAHMSQVDELPLDDFSICRGAILDRQTLVPQLC
jgi:hypothetical protein